MQQYKYIQQRHTHKHTHIDITVINFNLDFVVPLTSNHGPWALGSNAQLSGQLYFWRSYAISSASWANTLYKYLSKRNLYTVLYLECLFTARGHSRSKEFNKNTCKYNE